MKDPVFPIFCGLALVLLLLPLPLQIKSRNWALICYLFWLTALVLIYFVNSIIWANSIADVAPVWCDINTKLQVGAQLGVPSAATAVLRQLERIASTRIVSQTPAQKRRNTVIDLCLGVALPISFMVTHVVVQGHRYDIVQEFGCIFTLYRSWPMLFLVTLPPLVFSVSALVYAVLAFRWFIVRRRQFMAVLMQTPSSGLTTSRYLRLLVLTSMELFISFPGQVVNAYYNLKPTGVPETSFPLPYVSWQDVHDGFDIVGQFTVGDLYQYSPSSYIVPEYLRWTIIVGAFLVFFCLGCSHDNVRYFKSALASYKFRRAPQAKSQAPAVGFQQRIDRVIDGPSSSASVDKLEEGKQSDLFEM